MKRKIILILFTLLFVLSKTNSAIKHNCEYSDVIDLNYHKKSEINTYLL